MFPYIDDNGEHIDPQWRGAVERAWAKFEQTPWDAPAVSTPLADVRAVQKEARMAGIGRVDIDVNHYVDFTRSVGQGCSEEDQIADVERIEELKRRLEVLYTELGFSIDMFRTIESRGRKNGSFPEVHVVLVQLPSEVWRGMGRS
jgi:hypothetical protein